MKLDTYSLADLGSEHHHVGSERLVLVASVLCATIEPPNTLGTFVELADFTGLTRRTVAQVLETETPSRSLPG